ncbi:MAG: hypothetical protein OXC81_07750, partial [Betaproteobacteria bacterium]|nr:hypothetical protein [Betaproteobacteria bacterium]
MTSLSGELKKFEELHTQPHKVHKPILILMMLARLKSEGTGALRFNEIVPVLKQLLKLFATSDDVRYPFWCLQSDGVWRVAVSRELVFPEKKGNSDSPLMKALRKHDPIAGFAPPIIKEFKAAAKTIDQVADY